MNYGLLLYLKLARVDVGNVSKKGENMEVIIAWSVFASWFFNRTLSINDMNQFEAKRPRSPFI